MTKLEQARKKINEIDEKMAKLFEERMEASKEVALYKKEKFIHIYFIVLLKYCQVKRIKSYRFSLQNN